MNLQPSSVHSLPSAQSLALEHLSSVPEHIGTVTRTTTQANSVKWRTVTLPAYFFALLSQQRNTSSLLVELIEFPSGDHNPIFWEDRAAYLSTLSSFLA